MKKYLTEEHDLFRESLSEFLEREVRPNLEKWEKDGRIPKSIWKKMGDMGFLGLSYPEKYGGSGLDFFFEIVFNEELGKLNSGGFVVSQQVVQYMSSPYILKYGSDKLKDKYLPGIISGDLVGCIGITEPDAGSDTQNIQTKAIKKDGHYIINGSKTFITNAVYGDFVVLVVRTDPKAGSKGISLICVDLDQPGITKNKINKLGWHSSDTAELSFDNVKVSLDSLIGEEGKGFYYLMNGLQLERLIFLPSSIATMEFALSESLNYMSQRKAFGRTIDRFQVLRHRIAQLSSEVEALKAFSYYCYDLFDKEVYDVKLCSMGKLICTELHEKISTQCLQFFGGNGYTEDYPMARMYRDSRLGTIGAGTSEIMRDIISKMVIDDVKYKKAKTTISSANDSKLIDPYFNENHNLFRKSLKEFLNKEIVPNIDKWEQEGHIPKEVYVKFAEMGYFGLTIPEEYGGSSLDIWHEVILHEEMAKINSGGFAASMGAHFSLAMSYINKEGKNKQKEEYLIPGNKGSKIGSIAIKEPNGGSDLTSMITTAVSVDDHYIVNGAKTFITNGANSDYIVTAVKTKSESGTEGISMLIIDKKYEGITSTKLEKLGWKCSGSAEVQLDNVKVPITNLLGNENAALNYINEHSILERLSVAVATIATAEQAISLTVKFINKKDSSGLKLSESQVLRHRIAQMASEVECYKQFVYSLYERFEHDEPLTKEASMAKLICTQLLDKVTTQCLQMYGGYGYMENYPLARMFRDSRLNQIEGDSSEILCEIISKIIIDKK